jgi:exopolysaccharide biosynthesis polyprenyl glycosylphosphotransferase
MRASQPEFEINAYHDLAIMDKPFIQLSSETQWRGYKLILLSSDVLMLGAAFFLAHYIRFNVDFPLFQTDAMEKIASYRRLVAMIGPIWLILFLILGLYKRENILEGYQEYSLVFQASTYAALAVVVASFIEERFILARAWLLMSWFLTALFVALGRFWLRRMVFLFRGYGFFVAPAIIVGANDEGIQLARQLSNSRYSGMKILGFVDKKFPVDMVITGNLRVLGNLEHLDELLKDYKVEELILASSSISSRDKLMDIFKNYGLANHLNVRMSSGLYEVITTGLIVREFAYVPLVGVEKVRMTGLDNTMKILLDYGLTIPAVIILSPLLALLALLIKLDSPGPVIHRRRVMGVNNSQFDAFKFRTMYENGDEILAQYPELQKELAETHKLKEDPRITRVGRFLRKWSLDEFPQLFNVLRYEMSLVGPRMIHPDEMKMYAQWGINLLTVRPGISGLWQVSGRSDITYEERVRIDMHYIRNWSIWMDLQVIWRTPLSVISRKGAY